MRCVLSQYLSVAIDGCRSVRGPQAQAPGGHDRWSPVSPVRFKDCWLRLMTRNRRMLRCGVLGAPRAGRGSRIEFALAKTFKAATEGFRRRFRASCQIGVVHVAFGVIRSRSTLPECRLDLQQRKYRCTTANVKTGQSRPYGFATNCDLITRKPGCEHDHRFCRSLDVLFNPRRSLEARLASDWLQDQTATQGLFPPINVFQQVGRSC